MIDRLPFIGSSSNSRKSDGLLASVVGFLDSGTGLVLAGISVVLALAVTGQLGLPDGSRVQLLVALELLALYLVLHELDAYSLPFFVAVGGFTTFVGLSATGEPVIASILNSEVGVILVIGALYLGYRWLKQRDSSQQKTIVVQGSTRDDNDGGGR